MPDPSIAIQGWRYTKVTTEQAEYAAQVTAAGLTPASETKTTVVETVAARFELFDAEPFAKTRRSTNQVRPEALNVVFTSTDNGAWYVEYGMTLTGSNILKGGKLGSEQVVRASDWPEEIRALVTTGKYTYDPAGQAADWIYGEYPR